MYINHGFNIDFYSCKSIQNTHKITIFTNKLYFKKIKTLYNYIVLFLLGLGAILFTNDLTAQFYNGTHVGFGKNRVQYDYFEWKYYRYSQYETYYYTGGKELAIYTAKVARKHIKDQEAFFEYDLRDKIQFIVYNKQSHFKQSNVGLSLENGEIGGITNIMGSKVYIYFNEVQRLNSELVY